MLAPLERAVVVARLAVLQARAVVALPERAALARPQVVVDRALLVQQAVSALPEVVVALAALAHLVVEAVPAELLSRTSFSAAMARTTMWPRVTCEPAPRSR